MILYTKKLSAVRKKYKTYVACEGGALLLGRPGNEKNNTYDDELLGRKCIGGRRQLRIDDKLNRHECQEKCNDAGKSCAHVRCATDQCVDKDKTASISTRTWREEEDEEAEQTNSDSWRSASIDGVDGISRDLAMFAVTICL